MQLDRRKFLKASSAAVIGSTAVAGSASAASFAVSTPVFTTTDLSVRDNPGTEASLIAVAEKYTGGEVVDGPVNEDGYTWWEVSFNEDSDNGRVTGWAAEGDGWLAGPADFALPAWGVISQPHKSDHPALDIANDLGTSLTASASGTVAVADSYDDSPCGKYVIIDHGGGWETTYCHMQQLYVSTGDSVNRDTVIGEMGSSGRSTGSHVHFEIVKDGVEQYIPGFDGQNLVGGAGIPKNYF